MSLLKLQLTLQLPFEHQCSEISEQKLNRMEEMLLRICVLVVSLLYIKDPNVFEEQDKDIIMREREDLLQIETTKLEQDVNSLATELPYSNKEVVQGEELEESDVQLMMPNDQNQKSKKYQDALHDDLFKKDKQNELQDDTLSGKSEIISQRGPNAFDKDSQLETLSSKKEMHPEIVSTGQNESKDIVLKVNKDVSTRTNAQKHYGSDSTPIMDRHSFQNSIQAAQMDSTSSFQNIYELIQRALQTSQNVHSSQQKKTLEDTGESQMLAAPNTVSTSEELQGNKQNCSQMSENMYVCYFWKVLSLLSIVRLLKTCFTRISKKSEKSSTIKVGTVPAPLATKISLPDSKIITSFYDQCVQIPLYRYGQVCEFVEGFVDELLEAARESSSKEVNMQIGEFIGVGSLYETWTTDRSLVCDLYAPITALKPFGFEVEFLKGRKDFGKIKMIKTENACPCTEGSLDEENMLCLLHTHNEATKVIKHATDGMLCQANTPYLAKRQVVRWFRMVIKNAWRKICHRYEFELAFRNQVAPGALKVRFKSGWVIPFNITPVVQVEDSKVYLVSHLPNIKKVSDTYWPVSFATYEKILLQFFNDILPSNSCHIQCLQILIFLHKQQNNLTGRCGITSYHFKSTLLHLLLTQTLKQWESEKIADRLNDMLRFLEQRIQEGTFDHALLGNTLVPGDIKFPEEFQTAKSTNIFQPLLSDRDPVNHLKELIKNAPVLIQEYSSLQ